MGGGTEMGKMSELRNAVPDNVAGLPWPAFGNTETGAPNELGAF